MSNSKRIGGILEDALKEIIKEKGYTMEKSDSLLKDAENLIGLAMAGYNNYLNEGDKKRVKDIIENGV